MSLRVEGVQGVRFLDGASRGLGRGMRFDFWLWLSCWIVYSLASRDVDFWQMGSLQQASYHDWHQ